MISRLQYLKTVVIAFALFCFACNSEPTVDANSSASNGKLMEQNLNEPNAVNPANHNDQKYEKIDKGNVKHNDNIHPATDISNSYNTKNYVAKDSTKTK